MIKKYIIFGVALALLCSIHVATTNATTLFPSGGGTGTSTAPTSGQIPIGNSGNTYSPAYLTPGTNITISTSSGGITINSSGGGGGSTTTINGANGPTFNFNSSSTGGSLVITSSTSGGSSTILFTWTQPDNKSITLTGIITGSGTSTIATVMTTSTLYSFFSGTSPIVFNTSTGAISCATCITSAVTSANSITGAVNWKAAGTGLTVASSGQDITYTWTNPGYITTSTGLTTANFATTSISQWNNDSGYITTSSRGVVTSSLGSYTIGNIAFMIDSSTISASSGFSISSGTGNVKIGGTLNATGSITQAGTAVVLTSRAVNTGQGLQGGGDLSADRTLSINTSTALTWSGAQTFTGGLTVNSTSTFNSSTIVSTNLAVGTSTISSTLNVVGTSTLNGTTYLTTLAGSSGCLSVDSAGKITTSGCFSTSTGNGLYLQILSNLSDVNSSTASRNNLLVPTFDYSTTTQNAQRLQHSFINFLSNGSFEYWLGGVSSAPSGWTLQGATAARNASSSLGSYSAAVSTTNADDNLRQSITAYPNVWYTCSAWYKRTSPAGQMNIVLQENGGSFTEYATVGMTLTNTSSFNLAEVSALKADDGVNSVRCKLAQVGAQSSTYQFDEVMLQEGKNIATAFTPLAVNDTDNAQNIFGTPNFLGGANFNATTTLASTTILSGTVSTTIASALIKTGSDGTIAAYGGASACGANQFVTTISALGATTCGTPSGGGGGVATSSGGDYAAGNVAFMIDSSTISATSAVNIVSSTGATTFKGNVFLGGTLNVTSTSRFNGAMTVSSSLTQSGAVASLASTTINGNATTTNLTVTSIGAALVLSSSAGVQSAYGGASACGAGNAVTTISAVGGTTCAAFGSGNGTLTGNGTATYIPYYDTATAFLNNSKLTYASSTDLFSVGSSTIAGVVKVTAAPAATTSTGQTNFGATPQILPSASGTYISGNTVSGYNGDWIALQNNSSTVFRVASSGATTIGNATTTFQIFTNGHIDSTGTVPTLSSCGTSPNATGTDSAGIIQVGSVAATACTLTFASAYVNTPSCLVTNQNMSVVNAMTYTVTTTTLVISETGLTSAKLNYMCIANE